MFLRRFASLKSLVVLVFAICLGCNQSLTREEARIAMEESALSSQAVILVSGTIEISTNFTIGQAVEEVIQDLRDFIASQLPCAEIVIDGNSLSVEYGANEGNCTYNGHTFSGNHTISLTSTDEGNVVVDHEWTDLSNGLLTVSGTAQVTWSDVFSSRQVVHELDWERLSDGRQATGGGDRMQTTLDGGWAEGITINGSRYWNGQSGDWDLDINNVEVRWDDPVPQSGSYTLDTPFDKSATFSFERIDEDTIEVTITSGRKTFTFRVSKLGGIS